MSTGPTTGEGKAVVATNAIRHGLTAQAIVIPSEAQDDWDAHAEATVDSFAPATPVEHALALRVAELFWRLRRAARAERDLVARSHARWESGEAPGLAAPIVAPEIFLQPILRYEAHLNRQLYQALHELESLQDRRAGKAAPLARVHVHGLPGQ
jgi:hypothetical protein